MLIGEHGEEQKILLKSLKITKGLIVASHLHIRIIEYKKFKQRGGYGCPFYRSPAAKTPQGPPTSQQIRL